MIFRPAAAAAALAACLAAPAAAQERTMIVLDSSGSMWGQIDGTAKVQIARETLAQVLGGSEERALGLMAYGHRRKGDCGDIELLLDAAPGQGAAIAEAAEAIRPLGKTPLSAAVEQAADALKYTEEKATVVLITDGLETCNADPCALGTALEEAGVDFTAHVVGFGLSDEEGRLVSCLAENTGGMYIQAANAEELTGALTQTVAAPAPEPEPEAEPAPLPEASLMAPPSAPIASVVTVAWDAPGERYDQVQLFDPAAMMGEGKVLRSYSVRHGDMEAQTVRVSMPATPGAYELRYYYGETRDILATLPIEALEAEVTLDAPDQVAIAATITVTWKGPGARYDEVQLYDPQAMMGEGKVLNGQRVRNGDFEERRVSFPVPAEPGGYVLRYWNGEDREVLAERPVTVVDAPVTLEAPESAAAGSTVAVDWIGPGARYDEVQLFAPGGEKPLDSARLRNGDFANQRVDIVLPVEPGAYELRYWNGDYRKLLATRAIEVTPVDVSLDAPGQASGGDTITVSWVGPGGRYDEVQLFAPGGAKAIDSARLRNGDFEAQQVQITVPVAPGAYELRYWNGDYREVLATAPLEVVAVQAGIDAPEAAEAGSRVTVGWQGPGARYDEVQLFAPGGDKALDSARVVNGDVEARQVQLTLPVEPGAYELRYWNGDSRVVMSTAQIEVTPVQVSLEAPAEAQAASTVEITWQGPGARYDEVQLLAPDGDKAIDSTRVVNGDVENRRVSLVMPARPGPYILRYWNGDYREVLAERPIEVTPVEVTLDAPAQIGQALPVQVTWDGPGARYDEIRLVDPLAPERAIHSMRVRNGDFDNRQVTLPAPARTGGYLLHYWNGDNRVVLAERPIEVVTLPVSITAEGPAPAGGEVTITWDGPGARYDEVQILSGAGEVVASKRVRNGDFANRQVTLDAPEAAGAYRLRYWNGDNKASLAEAELTVE